MTGKEFLIRLDDMGELTGIFAAQKANDTINYKLNVYLSKRLGHETVTGKRLLSHLPVALLNRINREMESSHGKHITRLLVDTYEHHGTDFIITYLDLLSTLDQQHHGVATDYFIALSKWNVGDSQSLDLMVRLSSEYLAATGEPVLPFTTKQSQYLFARLHECPQLIPTIVDRLDRLEKITPELLDELSRITPPLIEGVI